MLLRTPEITEKYRDHLAHHKDTCPLCEAKDEIKDYTYWKIIPNHFPYDLFAKTHHMLVAKRHVLEKDLTEEELKEYHEIKEELLNSDYEFIMEGTRKRKSIPQHYHLHLIITK